MGKIFTFVQQSHWRLSESAAFGWGASLRLKVYFVPSARRPLLRKSSLISVVVPDLYLNSYVSTPWMGGHHTVIVPGPGFSPKKGFHLMEHCSG